MTKSGPAQTTAEFAEIVPIAESALVLASFATPNGYPDEQAPLDVASGGASCATRR